MDTMAVGNIIEKQLVGGLRRSTRREVARTVAGKPAQAVLRRDARAMAAAGLAGPERAVAAYHAANRALAGKYPTLDKVLADPDRFVAEVRRRFEAQRKLDPRRAYRFEFGDYGVPVLKAMVPMLDAAIAKIEGQLAARRPWAPWRAWSVADRRETIAHLKDLRAEVRRHVASGKVDYQAMLELGYYASRAMGRYDLRQLNLRDQVMLAVDRKLQGHGNASIAAERAAFKAREMSVFDAISPVGGFRDAMAPFEQAYLNPNKLEMITLPTHEALGTDVFMRLSNHPIFLVGVTQQPVAADGFIRPSSDFWMHDIRHNSAIFAKHQAFARRHGITAETAGRLSKQIDVWRQELLAAQAQIEDRELGRAVRFFEFNYHHDRGYPLVPSSYTRPPEDPTKIAELLHRTLKFAGQKMEDDINVFANRKATLQRAWEWLHAFWSARAPQERVLLGPAARR